MNEEIFNKKQTERLNKLKEHLFNIENKKLLLKINNLSDKKSKLESKGINISARIPLNLYNKFIDNSIKHKKTKSSYLRLLIKRGLKNE